MAEPSAKLSLADQVFVNAMSFIATSLTMDPARMALSLELVREVLPGISRGHAYIEPVAEQADRMLALGELPDRADRRREYSSARTRAGMALSDLYFWRLGLAREAWRARQGGKAA